MRNHILSTAFLAVLLSLAGACAQEDGDPLDTDTDYQWPTEQSERIWVDGRSVGAAGDEGQVGDGACACTTADCFESWVVDGFGCDLCVSFVCDGVTVAHACSPCEETGIHDNESWQGDGSLDR